LYAFFWAIGRLANHPEESIQYSNNGESLKSRIVFYFTSPIWLPLWDSLFAGTIEILRHI
jgi:hypothetical protein